MHYKRIELKVTNQGIHERKIFQGVKIFSRSSAVSKTRKSIRRRRLALVTQAHRLLSTDRCQL